jgi:hypothetical protein
MVVSTSSFALQVGVPTKTNVNLLEWRERVCRLLSSKEFLVACRNGQRERKGTPLRRRLRGRYATALVAHNIKPAGELTSFEATPPCVVHMSRKRDVLLDAW